MKIEIIYTFYSRGQKFANCEITVSEFRSKRSLFEFLIGKMGKSDMAELVKISCCVENGNFDVPDWYDTMNGKFWLNDIEGYRNMLGIKSNVPSEYVVTWLGSNKETLKLDWL